MSGLAWQGVRPPSTLTPKQVQAVLLSLAALPGQPRLVLEAIGRGHQVAWRLGADDDLALRRAVQVLRTQLPDALLVAAPAGLPNNGIQLAAQVRFSRSRQLPLAASHANIVGRSLLAGLELSP